VFSKVFSYFPLIYVTLKNISARPPIYVLFSKYEDSFVFPVDKGLLLKNIICRHYDNITSFLYSIRNVY